MKNEKGERRYREFTKHAEKILPKERIQAAKERARQEVQAIKRLAEIRQYLKVNQADVKGFSQADVSKLEKREDLKLSTLIKYATGLDAGLSIKMRLKGDKDEEEEVTLVDIPARAGK